MAFNPGAAPFAPGAGFMSPEVAAINDLMDRLSLACKEEAPRAAAAAAPKPVASAAAAAAKPAAPSGGIKIMRAGAPAGAPAAAAPAASGWGAGGASAASRGGVSRDNAAKEIGEYVKARGVRVLKVRDTKVTRFLVHMRSAAKLSA